MLDKFIHSIWFPLGMLEGFCQALKYFFPYAEFWFNIIMAIVFAVGLIGWCWATLSRKKDMFLETPKTENRDYLPEIENPTQSSSNREFVEVTPTDLISYFSKQLTDIQAHKLVEAYIGKWIKVSGKLSNVDPFKDGFSLVGFDGYSSGKNKFLHMIFRDQKTVEKLSVMKRGQLLTVLGRISDVKAIRCLLDYCELVEG